jgi:hypothetical protein
MSGNGPIRRGWASGLPKDYIIGLLEKRLFHLPHQSKYSRSRRDLRRGPVKSGTRAFMADWSGKGLSHGAFRSNFRARY